MHNIIPGIASPLFLLFLFLIPKINPTIVIGAPIIGIIHAIKPIIPRMNDTRAPLQ
ncbi:hypothetical protein [Clostridium folliculivorans]|uniref:hypothetical protein n=1 Tax=Clostridium folliculivorans TaxID=2886038 RepID=UPI0021C4C36C|nr:hypothetical protein [Clostridium folliculivorans]